MWRIPWVVVVVSPCSSHAWTKSKLYTGLSMGEQYTRLRGSPLLCKVGEFLNCSSAICRELSDGEKIIVHHILFPNCLPHGATHPTNAALLPLCCCCQLAIYCLRFVCWCDHHKMFKFLMWWGEWLSADELGLQPHHCQESQGIQHPAMLTPHLQEHQAVAAARQHNEC